MTAPCSGRALPTQTLPLPQLLDRLPFVFARPPRGVALNALTDLQWRADRCTEGSVLCFQCFADGRSDAELYARYLARSRFGVLVTNRVMDCFDRLPGKGLYVTAPEAWGEVLARLCDHLIGPLPTGWQWVGVTGTNGKTTTVKYLEAMLAAAGRRVLGLGTLGLALNGAPLGDTGFTSPPLIELRRILDTHRDRADTLVMEVSSHALDQGRVHGLRLDGAAWTNFSQDHLDYHGDEGSYFAAKARILDLVGPGGALLTTSPEVARRLQSRGGTVPVEVIAPAVLAAEALRARPFLALDYNRANYALAEALARRVLGYRPERPWQALRSVDGRFECRVVGSCTIVVDFAHTPDALDQVLAGIRRGFPGAHVLVLFGCGGDRDQGKRPLMGQVACRHADEVILTSDNPRFEDPAAIIGDILAGTGGCGIRPTIVVDRAEAIGVLLDRVAVRGPARPTVALIAGKGHERSIERNGRKTAYSDQDEVARHLARLGWGDDEAPGRG
jgi:UDP-N-acetylmuramoyl-L-alanyl-D-glutamate--2,6-diaminopimelate ligase